MGPAENAFPSAVCVYHPSLLRQRTQRIHPVLTLLPVGIMGSVVLFDLGAAMSGFPLFGTVAHWDMAMGLMTGLTVLTVLLIDLTTALSGTAAYRVLGTVSSATAGMVIVFALVWWVRQDGSRPAQAPQILVELAAVAIGATGVWHARSMPAPPADPPAPLGLGGL